MDNVAPQTRSRIMSAIRSSGTKPETALSETLGEITAPAPSSLPCRPDLWLPTSRIAVFADGDFWHGCPVHGKLPKSNTEYWAPHLASNTERDRRDELRLLREGILPVRAWECEIKRRPGLVSSEIRTLHERLSSKTTSLAELAWAAGIIDGEGTISIMGNKATGDSPFVCVGISQEDVLERLRYTFGFGSVSHWSSTRQQLFKWRSAGSLRTSTVCRWLKCLLIIKRPQAELVSIWCSTVQASMARKPVSQQFRLERERITQSVRSLNARGRGASWRRKLSESAKASWETSHGVRFKDR